jgi:hypothetical protein
MIFFNFLFAIVFTYAAIRDSRIAVRLIRKSPECRDACINTVVAIGMAILVVSNIIDIIKYFS